MPGDRWGTDGEPRCDIPGELACVEVLEYLTSRRVGQSPKHPCVVVHVLILAILLTSIKSPVRIVRLPHFARVRR